MIDGIGVNGASSVSGLEQGLGIEEMMMLVQAQRAENLESQMADQIKEIQSRNQQVHSFSSWLPSF